MKNIILNRKFQIAVLLVVSVVLFYFYNEKAPYAEGGAKLEDGDLPIAVVNVEEIFNQANAFKNIQSQIEAKVNEMQASVSQKQERLQEKHKKIESQKAALSEQALAAKVEELNKEFEEINKEAYMSRLTIDRAYKNALRELDSHFSEIVERIAKDRGYKLVFNKVNTIYAIMDDKMDISQEVLAHLNKKLPNYKLDFKSVEKEIAESGAMDN